MDLFDSPIFSLIFLLYIILICSYFFFFIIPRRLSQKKKKKLECAFDMLNNGFSTGTFADSEDIFLIYKNVIKPNTDISYADFLESYIIHLRQENNTDLDIIDISNRLKTIIKSENCQKPFENVNDHERRLLISIDDAAKNKETASISYSLTELSEILISNQKRLKRANSTNYWTVPISIIGFILTIISLIFSLHRNTPALTTNNTKDVKTEVMQHDNEIQQD